MKHPAYDGKTLHKVVITLWTEERDVHKVKALRADAIEALAEGLCDYGGEGPCESMDCPVNALGISSKIEEVQVGV